ncbi:hypothetical protein [Helicobacter muridarum]|uniref:Uncharacterized protein n=1 Tax=Helicobacter muridarum TaxID=216 RepID=A0A377PSM7_9HELI|nr:hypothetical protein [Helicobacter muridarum]STQ85978.1 Uncharacterised protein [Helicobacter muridarum]
MAEQNNHSQNNHSSEGKPTDWSKIFKDAIGIFDALKSKKQNSMS